ncbi:MAG: tetratricopeptide repeat protein [Thermoguttaceae bacterium]
MFHCAKVVADSDTHRMPLLNRFLSSAVAAAVLTVPLLAEEVAAEKPPSTWSRFTASFKKSLDNPNATATTPSEAVTAGSAPRIVLDTPPATDNRSEVKQDDRATEQVSKPEKSKWPLNVAAVPVFGSTAKRSNTAKFYEDGTTAERERRFEDAERLYQTALVSQTSGTRGSSSGRNATPTSPYASLGHINHRLAVVEWRLGKPQLADAAFQRAMQDSRDEVRAAATVDYARFCEQYDQLSRAETLWRNLLLEDPESTSIGGELARVLMKQGRYQEGLRYTLRPLGEEATYRMIATAAQMRGDDGVAEYAIGRLTRSAVAPLAHPAGVAPQVVAAAKPSIQDPPKPTDSLNNMLDDLQAAKPVGGETAKPVRDDETIPEGSLRYYHYAGNLPPNIVTQPSRNNGSEWRMVTR